MSHRFRTQRMTLFSLCLAWGLMGLSVHALSSTEDPTDPSPKADAVDEVPGDENTAGKDVEEKGSEGEKDLKSPEEKKDKKAKSKEKDKKAKSEEKDEESESEDEDKKAESEEKANSDGDETDGDETDEDEKIADGERFKPSTREFTFPELDKRTVLFFKIEGPIDLGLAPFIERVIEEAESREDVVAILTEINTPGGRVDAAVQIKNVLLESTIPTIAWVHSEAISAGALIAYAHDGIFFSTGGTMGAATPIQMAPGGDAQPVGEKVVSYMRGVMRATAEANDRDGELAEAMVDASIEIPGISKKDKLSTLTDAEALKWGVGDGAANSRKELLETLGLGDAQIEERETNWAEGIARFLTGPTVSGLLMAIGMLGIFLEFSSPGFGLPGIVGLLSFLLFFTGHYVVHLAGLEEMAILGVGMVLLGLEILVIPGFGLAGIAGILAMVAALVMMMVALPLEVSWELGSLNDAISRVSIAFALTVAMGFAVFRFLPRTTPVRRLVLNASMAGEQGFESFDMKARSSLVGSEGVVAMDLRPSGKVRINDALVDVVSEGGFIGKGTPIKVISAEGARVMVRASKPADGGTS